MSSIVRSIAINDSRAFYETAAERAFLAAIEASCTTPVGVKASIVGNTLALAAMLFSPDGARRVIRVDGRFISA